MSTNPDPGAVKTLRSTKPQPTAPPEVPFDTPPVAAAVIPPAVDPIAAAAGNLDALFDRASSNGAVAQAAATAEGLAPTGAMSLATLGLPASKAQQGLVPATRPEVPEGVITFADDAGITGEVSGDDLQYPRIQIVNGSGELSKQYNQGTTLLANEQLLPPPDPKTPKPNETFRVVPIHVHKQWRENLTEAEQAQGLMPQIVDTAEEAENIGGTCAWVGGQKPRWSPSARIFLLVEAPEGTEHPGFVNELDGSRWAVAVLFVGGSVYNHSAKVFITAAATTLMEPVLNADGTSAKDARGVVVKKVALSRFLWDWRTVKRAAGNFTVFGPELRTKSKAAGPEVRAFCDMIRSSI